MSNTRLKGRDEITLEEYIKASAEKDIDEMPDNIAAGFLSNLYSVFFNFDSDSTTALYERAKKDQRVAGYYKTALRKAIDKLDRTLYGD